MKLNTHTFDLNGISLTAYYTVSGKYYPATQYEPEEFPDVEVHKITLEDNPIDIQELLHSYEEEIYKILNDEQRG